jgi:hypothetical protein
MPTTQLAIEAGASAPLPSVAFFAFPAWGCAHADDYGRCPQPLVSTSPECFYHTARRAGRYGRRA